MAIPKLQTYVLPESHNTPQNKVDWALEPQRTALLVHDMQDCFVSFWDENYPIMEQVIVSIVALRDYYKQRNILVYYTTQPRKQSDEDRALLNDMWGPDLIHSPEQQKVVGHLTLDVDDTALVRWCCSAFHRSLLGQMPRESGCNRPIITGVYTRIDCITTATDTFMCDIRPLVVADAPADFGRDEHLMSLKYVAGCSGRVVMTEELLPAPIPASRAELREVILPLLGESDEPFDDDNLIDYSLDSVRMMVLAARWCKVHGDIDFVMLAKNPIIGAWWKLLSRKVK